MGRPLQGLAPSVPLGTAISWRGTVVELLLRSVVPMAFVLLVGLCAAIMVGRQSCRPACELRGFHQDVKSQDMLLAACHDLQEDTSRDAGRPCAHQQPAHGRTWDLPSSVQHDVLFSSLSLVSA